MMGLSRNALWSSYFIHSFILFFISAAILTAVLCIPFTHFGAIINHSHWTLVFIFILLYGVSLIMLGFLIASWFKVNKSRI